jgi:DNA-binding MarR family transcriptional regulator
VAKRDARLTTMTEIEELLHTVFGKHFRRGKPPLPHNMTLGQLECLRSVGCLGNPSMSELAQALGLQPSTVTGLVDALIKYGRVQRGPDPSDRRVVRVSLTPAGVEERDRLTKEWRDRLMELLGDLSDEELRMIHDGLSALDQAGRRRPGAETCCGTQRDGDGS